MPKRKVKHQFRHSSNEIEKPRSQIPSNSISIGNTISHDDSKKDGKEVEFHSDTRWEHIPWKGLNTSDMTFDKSDEVMFYELEEIDGQTFNQLNNNKKSKKNNNDEFIKKSKSKSKFVSSANIKNIEILDDIYEDDENNNDEINHEYTLERSSSSSSSSSVVHFYPQKLIPLELASWNNTITLHRKLQSSLVNMEFQSPTKIQKAAIPVILDEKPQQDVVGAAETGSGKTLAFGIPIINSLLHKFAEPSSENETMSDHKGIYALIMAPTRELCMQISSVLRDVCKAFKNDARVEVVTLIGGMSEQKQRRQLGSYSEYKKSKSKGFLMPHIIVGTPGRLCDLIHDDDLIAFSDMSKLRYLVVDEADRMVEEGHFLEINRIFARILAHEQLAAKQLDLETERNKAQVGLYVDDIDEQLFKSIHKINKHSIKDKEIGESLDENNIGSNKNYNHNGDDNDDGDDDEDNEEEDMDMMGLGVDEKGLPVFPTMPTEEELEVMRQNTPAIPYSDDEEEAEGHDINNNRNNKNKNNIVTTINDSSNMKNSNSSDNISIKSSPFTKKQLSRQTLLFSATALKINSSENRAIAFAMGKKVIKDKSLRQRITALGPAVKKLPEYIQKMIATMGCQSSVQVIDVTTKINENENEENGKEDDHEEMAESDKITFNTNLIQGKGKDFNSYREAKNSTSSSSSLSLPAGLSHVHIRIPADEKDLMAYYFILKYSGRILIFVNAVDTARRLDALLRTLGIHCRTVHAQLQQRQRIRALEAFQDAPRSVLVATDVAARGLDIPKIQYVLHYDLPRSPQIYIHRAGRTARASTEGTSISLVPPTETNSYDTIQKTIGKSLFNPLKVDLAVLPLLRKRIKAAKKMFTNNFISSQNKKEETWLQKLVKDADLAPDDYMVQEHGTEQDRLKKSKKEKKQLMIFKSELTKLLDESVPWSDGINASYASNRKGFVVVAR